MTEASRNFAECINRVRYQGLSFLLVKNGKPVARLVPPGPGRKSTVDARQSEEPEIAGAPAPAPAEQPEVSEAPQRLKHNPLQW